MVVASRPSNGKSSFLLQLAYNTAKQGLQTYFFSLEMTAEALSERLFCQVGQINNYNLFYKPTFYKKEAEDFKEMVKETPLIITYNIGTTIEQLFNILNDLPKADLVIIDYLQAIKSLREDRLSTLNDYIIRFKTLALEKNFCGILASQINRGAMEDKQKKPKLWLLKGSGTIEEHADTVLLLHWDYFYTNNEVEKNNFDIIVAKQRNGVTGGMNCYFYPQWYRFEEMPVETVEKVEMAKELFKGDIINDQARED